MRPSRLFRPLLPSMGFLLALALLVSLPGIPGAAESSLAGTWHGRLELPGLRIVFHFEQGAGGALTGTLDSPDQGARGIALGTITARGESLYVEVPAVRGGYAARRFTPDSLVGEWRQGGMKLPLGLARGGGEPIRRPQEPHGALPYDTTDVMIDTSVPGVRLAGTLTTPREAGRHPAALLISGSGPQNRNEEVFGHRPFLVIADHLTRHGFAVLRVDDRGVGESGGRFQGLTSDDFAQDAAACVAWLRHRPGIDPKRVGLIGHSEGGLIAPIVASRDPGVAFIVLLAGPAVGGERLILDQAARLRLAGGGDSASTARLTGVQRRMFALLERTSDTTGVAQSLHALLLESFDLLTDAERRQMGGDAERVADLQTRQFMSPWFRFFLSYDPEPALRALRCPTLALFGEKDLQVAPALNSAPMEQALAAAPAHDATVRVLPGLNHLFQKANTGLPAEYPRIEQTIDPAALDQVSGWLLERFGPDAGMSR